ncbi:PREDICTED: zinc finger protein 446-like [Elephantulus edwardii]|uniref:zinc finger protein 446-like n=1 Tax=Elephantulus edwardii TaxID=28737 RepID=UPI0003F081E5|nr:PREDICTED: zinc finger protein 446-like [Elephantulus edwardii]
MLQKYGTVISVGDEGRSLLEAPAASPEVWPLQGPATMYVPVPQASGVQGWTASPGPGLETRAPLRKPYICEQCGLGFDWKSVFVIHRRAHAGSQPAFGSAERPPPITPEPRSRPWHIPTGPFSYPCEECGRSFSWKSQLVIHCKSHVGHKRHFCGDCGQAFDWKSQLVLHRKSHRPETL